MATALQRTEDDAINHWQTRQQIIDALNSQSQWIRVEDNLPEPLKLVLIANHIGVWFGCYSANFNEWWDHDDALIENVKAWRELPTPPKDL